MVKCFKDQQSGTGPNGRVDGTLESYRSFPAKPGGSEKSLWFAMWSGGPEAAHLHLVYLCVLGHRLLANLPRKQQVHSCLDLSGGDGGALGGLGQARGLLGDVLKDFLNDRIHDAHGLV